MTIISAAYLPPPDVVAPACAKYLKPLSKKKRKPIDMDVIGTPAYNLLLDLLKCQAKHPNIVGGGSEGGAKRCAKAEKAYSACHAAVMGVGSYEGRKHCGEEMVRLFQCVNPDASL
ncbi:hypothetical protein ACHAWF_003644 [Thalassiosira exigua]